MVSVFLCEQKRYTQNNLFELFQCTEEKGVDVLKKLKEYGILRLVKANDEQRDLTNLTEEDVEVTNVNINANEYFYVFTFVGVIVVQGIVLKCYPKYIKSNNEPISELKQVLKVIEKYNAKEQIIRMYNESDENGSFNPLAVMLYLLNDYYENGSYTNAQDIIEVNGSGDILWDKTINETFTLISNNRPYYPELLTRKSTNDDFDYFKRLHECILTKSSSELESANLLDLFDVLEVNVSDEDLDDFRDNDYILDRIQKELNVQFNTRKQLVLKTLYAYVSLESSLNNIDCLNIFGTNSFNLVWEKICSEIMDNQLNSTLGSLDLPIPLLECYDRRKTLISLIEKPKWCDTDENGDSFKKVAKDTLIPDLISINKNGGDYQFIIFDAKYYNILFNKETLKGYPGIESITKQYLYQLAYKRFVEEHEFNEIRNCFLFPAENNQIISNGYIELEMLHNLGLENIQIRLLPATEVYKYYLQNKKMKIDYLNL